LLSTRVGCRGGFDDEDEDDCGEVGCPRTGGGGPGFCSMSPHVSIPPLPVIWGSGEGDYKSGKKIMQCSKATNGVGKGWRVQDNRGHRRAANRRVAKVGFARKVLFLRAASKALLLRPTEENLILRPAGIPVSFGTRRSPVPFDARRRLRFCGPRRRPGSYGTRKRAGSCAPRRGPAKVIARSLRLAWFQHFQTTFSSITVIMG
jgi:hypothetical protein